MKLLITGGAGFIGSNFVHYWIKHHPGDEIVVLDKLTYAGNLENLGLVKDKITFVQGDICDEKIVGESLIVVDDVVHFAAESHVDRSIIDPDVFVRTNVLGTNVLLHQSKIAGVQRFHHISTDEVFGSIALTEDKIWTEESSYNPRSPYSASKAASDHLVRAYGATYNLPFTISNCANNYGPYLYPEKLLSLAITNVLEGKKIPVYTPGNQIRDWLHVEDHCRAIDSVLSKGKPGETYCVGGEGKELSNLEVAKKICSLMRVGEDQIELVKDRPGHDARYAVDSSKIKKELGWKPKINFENGLRQMIEWYRAHESWWKPLKERSRKYYKKQYGI